MVAVIPCPFTFLTPVKSSRDSSHSFEKAIQVFERLFSPSKAHSLHCDTTHSVMASASPFALTVILSLLHAAVQASNVWTVNCAPLSVQLTDPIVNPGASSMHVHAISGGTAFSRDMSDPMAAVDALATTCDKYTDHSNYVRIPSLYPSQRYPHPSSEE